LELLRTGAPFVVVDRNEARVEMALRAVGISRAKGLVSAPATDADNLFVILSAKQLSSFGVPCHGNNRDGFGSFH
jgi:3-hydroxyisobutyrate dehydrogenase-like beta-hydroxyacid dehydrogenase